MIVRTLVGVAVALVVLRGGAARAYCRTTTAPDLRGSCPADCLDEGLPLAWRTPRFTYAFNERGFPGIDDATLRSTIAASLAPWEQVTCDGRRVGMHGTAERATTALIDGPSEEEPNTNVIVHFEADEWEARTDLSRHAFAVTAVWFGRWTGEITGADMMFNGGLGPFGECPESGCTATGPRADLRNVATHEFGHFLGLEHSPVPGSTMWCKGEVGEVSKRTLEPDDVAGLCEIYPPGDDLPEGRKASSCALTAEADASWGALVVGLVVGRGLRGRRRARSRGEAAVDA